MAINKSVRYEGRWEDSSTEYPMGKPKNRTSETAKDGTYFEKDWLTDYEAFFGAVMNENGSTPNGDVDTAEDSQIFDAMIAQKEVSNLLAANQNFNVPQDETTVLPSSTETDYATGEFFAKDRVAIYSGGLVGATYVDGILSASSGTYYARYKGDFSDYYYGVKLADDTITQEGTSIFYQESTGYTLVFVNVGTVGPHKFAGLSVAKGIWKDVSDEESEFLAGYGQVKTNGAGGELTQTFDELQEVVTANEEFISNEFTSSTESITYPNGMIEKFGIEYDCIFGGTLITLDTPFPSGIRNIQITPIGDKSDSNYGDNSTYIGVEVISNSEFYIYNRYTNGSGGIAQDIMWRAVGY